MSRDHGDVRLVRSRLDDARDLCDRLGLLSGRYGHAWQRQTRGVMVLCPWHDERSPSCSVIRGKDRTVQVCCHGCGATGDAIDLVAAVYGIDTESPTGFREALREAAHLAGVPFDDGDDWQPRAAPPPRPPPPPDIEPLDDVRFDMLARIVLDGCALTELPGRDVARYLNDRRLGRLALADGWGALPGAVADLERLRARCIEAVGLDAWMRSGLAVRSGRRAGAWVWSTHRLLIPWRGPDGAIHSLQRRCLGTPPEGVGKYIFPSGRAPRWPFGVDRLGNEPFLAIVEGATDTLALRAICQRDGVPADVIGLPGAQSWKGTKGAAWSTLARGRFAAVALDVDEKAKAREHVAQAVAAITRDLGAAGALRIDAWAPTGAKDWSEQWAAARTKAVA